MREKIGDDLDGFLQRRDDVRTILEMPYVNFQIWYEQKRVAVETLLKQYRLVADIPSFEPGPDNGIMSIRNSRTSNIDEIITSLETGLDSLNLIKDLREKGLKTR